mgnify:FL=1
MSSRNQNRSSKISVLSDGRGIIKYYGEDIFIAKNHLNGAFDKDEVHFSIQKVRYAPYKKAKVLKVIKRNTSTFIGRIYHKNKQVFVNVSTHQPKDIKLNDHDEVLADFTVVEVCITNWNERGPTAHGELSKIISLPDNPLADHLYVVNKYLGHRFSYEKHSKIKVGDLEKVILNDKNREDFTRLDTFSIDPDDAQDFDDAISIRFNEGVYDLKVHIADVSSFVKPDSDLDNAALQNSNSYYFPEKSYHMLPSELATKYCSLVPGENRLAVSLCFKLTSSGKILEERACLSIIKNKHRLTYNEVNDILINPQKTNLEQNIFLLYKLHKILKKNRLKDGALDLVSTESIFSFDLVGTPLEIKEKNQEDSHAMVEECMLLANKYAAKLLGSKGYPIYRNHDMPSRRSFLKIEALISAFTDRPKSFNDFILSFNSPNKRKIFSRLILKKLKRAEYSLINIGHYGLAFDTYLHFTSPIRRYADLVCHRLLKNILKNNVSKRVDSLDDIVNRINENEQKAKNAENEYNRLKKIKYLQSKKDKIFQCTIEGFSKKMIHLNINEVDFTAFIYKSHLKPDRYRVARNKHALVGQFSKKVFRVGDNLKAGVKDIDILNQEVFLYIC